MSEKYNGWTNYETWAVALHLNNEEASQSYWSKRAQKILEDLGNSRPDPFGHTVASRASWQLGDEIKRDHYNGADDLLKNQDASIFSDLLNSALSEVDWDEIAKQFIDSELETLASFNEEASL